MVLSQLKKISVSLPEQLLKETDEMIQSYKITDGSKDTRSDFVREALRLYIKEKKKVVLKEKMMRGYMEMAEINISYAEMCFGADCQIQCCYEEKLAECE